MVMQADVYEVTLNTGSPSSWTVPSKYAYAIVQVGSSNSRFIKKGGGTIIHSDFSDGRNEQINFTVIGYLPN